MSKPSQRPVRTALAAALLAALPGFAQAARIDYEVGASVLQSDNIALADTGEQDETVVMPQLAFGITQAGSRLQLNAAGRLQYLDYRDDTFDDGLRGSFSGQALWTLLPERLEWAFDDYLARQPIDTLQSFNPDNEQQVNYFITGPSLYVRMGAATRGQFDLRYSTSYAEDFREFDSDRYNAAARILRDLDPTRTISANVEATRVEYDRAPTNVDYTRYDGYARYTSRFRDFDLNLDLGASRLEFEEGGEGSWEPLFRGDLTWRASARSKLDAVLSYGFSDAAEDMVRSRIVGGIPGPDVDVGDPTVAITPSVFKQRRLELGYAFTGERFGLQVRPFYQRVGYVDATALDEKSWGGLLEATYKITPRMTLGATAAYTDRRYEDLTRRDRDGYFNIALENRFTRNWSASIALQRSQRNSTATGQDFEENAAIVSFSYRR
ncbi:MAG TPA: outer membrane beta-barrel protein [Luteimonas sp.]|nr:outer membrane beta-barrel protein [Luteimonas sp.]